MRENLEVFAAKEGEVTRSSLPLVLWLAAAFLSFAASVASWFLVDRQTGLFIGLWVPSILSLAVLLSLARVKP
ncbi:MAG TPA: hypothetical protein VE359_20330 [Vicinamibacteria bacterium]|nr:hypothetical protein [Vicinamibacteria bacterium]